MKYLMKNANDVGKSKLLPPKSKIQDPKIHNPKSKRPCLGPPHEERKLNRSKIQTPKIQTGPKIQFQTGPKNPKSKRLVWILYYMAVPANFFGLVGSPNARGSIPPIGGPNWAPIFRRSKSGSDLIGAQFPGKRWTRWCGKMPLKSLVVWACFKNLAANFQPCWMENERASKPSTQREF